MVLLIKVEVYEFVIRALPHFLRSDVAEYYLLRAFGFSKETRTGTDGYLTQVV